jgi:hypothetical protein
MQKAPHILIALFDASPEHAHFESPIITSRARMLAKELGSHGFGVVARIGSPVTVTVFNSLTDARALSVGLSPASSRREHESAYRLPFISTPTVFTGKGASGADGIALASGNAVLIFGSYAGVLENILGSMKDATVPIGVLTDEEPGAIHERVRILHPHLTAQLFVSHDSSVLVRELAEELRRRRLEEKLN